jgi:Transposase DDE domain
MLISMTRCPSNEDWEVLRGLFPGDWQEPARKLGAVERLRGFSSIEALMRTLLLHVAQGYSLRETVVRAKASGLATVSDVALLKRLRNAEPWLRSLCLRLLEENGVPAPPLPKGWRVRALDGSVVKEPGRTGSQWRLHYSLRLPSMVCDHLEVTAVEGPNVGEKLHRFPAQSGDLVLADRGMCNPVGIGQLAKQGAHVIVRVNTGSLPLRTLHGKPFDLPAHLQPLVAPGKIAEWRVQVGTVKAPIAGRLCVLRKSEEQARRAQRKILRKAQQGGPVTQAETLTYASYVIVFTTLSGTELSAQQVLEWYRLRWQIELIFKRLKTLLRVGHVPKYDDQSSKAWLYGKLFVALLAEKLIRVGRSISPWGYLLRDDETQPPQTQTA